MNGSFKTAVYCGSFSIFTIGHKYIADEALTVFDKLYIAVGTNSNKKPLFYLEDTLQMIKNVYGDNPKVEVISFEQQFLANFCRDKNINFIVRGLRNAEDLEYEKQINFMNSKINAKVKTVYFIPPTELSNISSSLVKSLIGLSEWQFVVQDMIPKSNMPYMMELAYPRHNLWESLKYSFYSLEGKNPINLQDIINKYNSSGRYYHTVQHILEMLNQIGNDYVNLHLTLAIIFHDIIYDPKSNTNEEDSCAEFDKLDMSSNHKKIVKELIMVTKTHNSDGSVLQNFMIDLDLAILGSDEIRFNEYERQIRQEYSFVSDEIYKIGRIDFIKKMLARPNIYLSQEFKDKYEVQAKSNLEKLQQTLENK